MANNMRWRYGDTNPVTLPVATDEAIDIGDLVYVASGAAVPASGLADTTTKEGNQEAFHDAFVGVAMQCSPEGSTDPIRIATSGVFEFDSVSATYAVGALIGVDENGSGTQLEPQVVAEVATANLAIGRCAKAVDAAATRVLVDVVSTVLKGGPQAAA
ncbi:MAG: hypothetical protein CMJ58_26535 [Planctomycetaceae bacterium]|nr:hypothetical protein [Planctomycetaceae bacterium]